MVLLLLVQADRERAFVVVVVVGGGDGILIGSLVCSGKSERPIKWSMGQVYVGSLLHLPL